MSYILEALEKSEQERKQRSVPGLQTKHTLYPGMTRARARRTAPPSRRLRPLVLFAILLLLTGWLFRDHLPVELEFKITRPSASPADQAPEVTVVAETQPEQAPIRTDAGTESEQTGVSQEATLQVAETPAGDAVITSAPATAGEKEETALVQRNSVRLQPAPLLLTEDPVDKTVSIVPPPPFLEDLPAAVRSEMPKLKFAGHTYSSTPKNRLIIINNDIRREGDAVEPELILEEITWEGVILSFRGVRFQVVTTGP